MKDLRKTFVRGDTLIEVIFAFAILATIIGYAFTGAIQARKTALAAQQRTQAVFLAQYQSQALKSYRDSLPWDGSGGITPSFIDGGIGSDSINDAGLYCMTKADSPPPAVAVKQWSLFNNTSARCPGTTLQPAPSEKVLQTSFECINPSAVTPFVNCDILRATVEVKWIDPYGKVSNVKNLVNLAKNF